MNTAQQFILKPMTKIIKGTLEYEITISEKDYVMDASPKVADEMAAITIVNMLLSYSKETLLKSLTQASGKHINALKDRLGKVNSAISMMQLMGSDYAGILTDPLMNKEEPKQADVTDQEPIMGLEDIKPIEN